MSGVEFTGGQQVYFGDKGCFHEGLVAQLKAIIVKDALTVCIYMEAGNCCDMAGAIELAKVISPGVDKIATFSGIEPDTVYRRVSGKWEAFIPQRRAQ